MDKWPHMQIYYTENMWLHIASPKKKDKKKQKNDRLIRSPASVHDVAAEREKLEKDPTPKPPIILAVFPIWTFL